MTFSLATEDKKKILEWLRLKDLDMYSGAIGGRFTYTFTPTSLGVVIKVIDNLVKDELDLTDYASW